MGVETQYQKLVGNLIPYGPAWDKSDPILLTIASILSYSHDRSDKLMLEIDPRTTTELIDRYETICGLPDTCYSYYVDSLTERRNRLNTKINLTGGLNESFFLAVLKSQGYQDATITRYVNDVFNCESLCTDSLYTEEWRYYWVINIPSATQITTMTCIDSCESSIRTWGDRLIECIIDKLCPSHTYVIFKYEALNA